MIRRAAYEVGFLAVLAALIWAGLELAVLQPMDRAVEREQRIHVAASCACRPLIKGRADCEAIVRDVLRRSPKALGKAEDACTSGIVVPQASPGVWH